LGCCHGSTLVDACRTRLDFVEEHGLLLEGGDLLLDELSLLGDDEVESRRRGGGCAPHHGGVAPWGHAVRIFRRRARRSRRGAVRALHPQADGSPARDGLEGGGGVCDGEAVERGHLDDSLHALGRSAFRTDEEFALRRALDLELHGPCLDEATLDEGPHLGGA
jgi:hypothetical protein